jgi:antitoxin (DNA-binding transcriptional repressor) of toxin-antitoxin stability system
MKTVTIGALKNQLSAHLRYVQQGKEVVVLNRKKPMARILPFELPGNIDADEAHLVATGQMNLEEQPVDWKAFWKLPCGNVSLSAAVQAAIESKGDR